MTFDAIFGSAGFVSKLDVSDLDASIEWYSGKLGLTLDPNYRTAQWAQMNIPGIPGMAIGLWEGGSVGTGGSVPTFVVDDIAAVRESLIASGVDVGPVEDVGDGALLAFFQDPDGNQLGIRQNGPSGP